MVTSSLDNTFNRNELSISRLANTLSFQKFNSDSNCSPIFDNTIEVLDENNFPKIDNLNVLITGILKEVEGIISTSIEHDSRTNTISKFKLNANGDKVEVSLSDETPPCIKGKLSPLLTVCVFALNYFGQANRSSHIQDTNFNKSYRKALKEFIKCCSFQNNHKICKTRIEKINKELLKINTSLQINKGKSESSPCWKISNGQYEFSVSSCMQKAGVKGPAFCVQGCYSKALKDFLFSLYKENYLNEIRADTNEPKQDSIKLNFEQELSSNVSQNIPLIDTYISKDKSNTTECMEEVSKSNVSCEEKISFEDLCNNLPHDYPDKLIDLIQDSYTLRSSIQSCELTDYAPILLSSYKSLEGHLHYLLGKVGIKVNPTGLFSDFLKDDFGYYHLPETKCTNTELVKSIEEAFNYYKCKRDGHIHFGMLINGTCYTNTIFRKDKAIKIIDEIFKIIQKTVKAIR